MTKVGGWREGGSVGGGVRFSWRSSFFCPFFRTTTRQRPSSHHIFTHCCHSTELIYTHKGAAGAYTRSNQRWGREKPFEKLHCTARERMLTHRRVRYRCSNCCCGGDDDVVLL